MAQRLSRRRLARELVRVIAEQPQQRADLVRKAAAYLVANKQVGQAHLLVSDIADELQASQGVLYAEIDSASELSSATRQAVADLLKKQTGAREVQLHTAVVPGLIGGVVVRTPRYRLDASIATQLKTIAGGL